MSVGRAIHLKHSSIAFVQWGCTTTFVDSFAVSSIPHDTHHYHVVSHRTGYGDDVLRYCQEHDFVHSFLAEQLFDSPSPTLWGVAHGKELSGHAAVFEELSVMAFQRWMRCEERPIVAGVDWDGLKRAALALLATLRRPATVSI